MTDAQEVPAPSPGTSVARRCRARALGCEGAHGPYDLGQIPLRHLGLRWDLR